MFEKIISGIPGFDGSTDGLDEYMGDNGLIHCAKCNTPKQSVITILSETRTVRVMCQCKAEERLREEEEQRKRQRYYAILNSKAHGIDFDVWRSFSFSDDDLRDKKASEKCRKYTENFSRMFQDNLGLLLYGDVGSGKTFLAACIANALIEQEKSVYMTNMSRLVASMNAHFGEEREYYLDTVANVDLLIIDDFGVERSTEYSLEQVYEVINERYKANAPLIITTNLTLGEIRNEQMINKRRIYDRVIELCYPLHVSGVSRRIQIAEKKRMDAARLLDDEA